MQNIVVQALSLWGMGQAKWRPFAKRENEIVQIEHGGEILAMRLHRTGYRTDAELSSELTWMSVADKGGISVPAPVPMLDGGFLAVVDGVQVDVLRWLPGQTLAERMTGDAETRKNTLAAVARAAAEFHQVCDAWTPDASFDRPKWDREGLVGSNPLWGRFWENPALSRADADLFSDFRLSADKTLRDRLSSLDYGLIHADLLGENVLIDEENVRLIDFDDGGWGFRLFELTTALIRQIDAEDYPVLRNSVLNSYCAVRPIDTELFDLFMALRATTYVGWIADRPDLVDAAQRQENNARIARRLISKAQAAA